MGRSGCVEFEECGHEENWAYIRWRGAVESSISGKRGQKMLKDLLKALDEMPKKELIADAFETELGCCALGALAKDRGMDTNELPYDDIGLVAETFEVANALVQEIMFLNDEIFAEEGPVHRWQKMRKWVEKKIVQPVD